MNKRFLILIIILVILVIVLITMGIFSFLNKNKENQGSKAIQEENAYRILTNVYEFSGEYRGAIEAIIEKLSAKNNIIVGAGWKPGRSTDYVAVLAAKKSGAKTIVNLTNIDYVYTKDPRKFPDAKPLKEINWKDFRKIVGSKWVPGYSSPFDPEASKLAEKLGLKVIIINGKNLDRLDNFLNNKPFIGTIIQ